MASRGIWFVWCASAILCEKPRAHVIFVRKIMYYITRGKLVEKLPVASTRYASVR